MIVASPLSLVVDEPSQIGEARRRILDLAAERGLDADLQGRLALVVNELGSNLVKHGRGGSLLVRTMERPPAVEVLAIDRGTGMTNVEECFRDGYSTAGSPGTGLGAVRRLATLVDVYTMRPGGTAIMARVSVATRPDYRPPALEIGTVSVPKMGEDVCGDGYSVADDQALPSLMVVDGLGHGAGAATAANLAVRAFEAEPGRSPGAQVAAIHDALRGSRGAAVSVACIDRSRGVVTYSGLGNVSGTIVAADGTSRRMVSANGTAGHAAGHIHEFTYPWSDEAVLVMHSDGLASRWQIERYPGLSSRHPSLVAGVLYRDWSRGRDDVTVVAARLRGA
ncbi:MAG TPA: SpoIIE family protein phosphatase [Methylomirabilota bacterium]